MDNLFYFSLWAIAVVGMIISLLVKNKSQGEKARLANVQYGFWAFIKNDTVSILISFLAILFIFLLFGNVFDPSTLKDPDKQISVLWIFTMSYKALYMVAVRLFFGTVGYVNQDLFLRLMGKTNAFLNARMDEKTTEADRASGNLAAPTPLK